MATQNTPPEAEKINFVAFQIDYVLCYKMNVALDNILNYPRPEPIPNYHELHRLNCGLSRVIMEVLQQSTVTDIQPLPLFEQTEVDNFFSEPF
jgi:hypothetical protein